MHPAAAAMQQLCLHFLMLALVTSPCIATNVEEVSDVPGTGLLSQQSEIAAATRATCEIKHQQVTGHQAWCLKSDICTAAGGVIKGIDGKCYRPGVQEDLSAFVSNNDVSLNEHVEETLKNKTKSDMPMVWSEKASEIFVEVYQTTGLSDEKVFEAFRKGIFTYTQASTVFVLIGKRLKTLNYNNSRNTYFHWKNAHDEENIYPFFREVQNFNKIVVVVDGPTAQLDGFVKAVEMLPFQNEQVWRKTCNVPKITINYSTLAELFLSANSQYFLNDWWCWFNEDAVDLGPREMTLFQVTTEFEKAMKAFFTAMDTVRKMDTSSWDKKACAAWGEHFKSLQAAINANAEGCQVTQIDGVNIEANVRFKTELNIDPDWMENFPEMLCNRLRMQESMTVCVPVFGKPNTDCEFSVPAMWRTTAIELEIRRSKYNRKRWTKYIQTMFVFSVFLCVAFLCVQLAQFGYSKFTTHINDASKPRKESMDSESTVEQSDEEVDGSHDVKPRITRGRAAAAAAAAQKKKARSSTPGR